MTRRAVARVALAIAAGLAAVACGVPTRDSVDRAKPEDVPFGLLDADRSPDATALATTGTLADLYVVDGTSGRLVRRPVTLSDGSMASVLQQLQVRPSGELGGGTANPLADAEVIGSADVRRGIATVDLTDAFAELSGPSQLAALAEIVYTATGRPGVGQVSFTLEGEPVDVPTGSSALADGPVTRSDYPSFAPAD